MRGVGAGAALVSTASAQAVADSRASDDPPVDDVTVLNDVEFRARDGTRLATDVYLPNLPGEQRGEFPTLLTRTPYNKEGESELAKVLARHEYAVVTQDVRGRYGSEGEFFPYRSEGAASQDSYDAVEWAAGQDWSNGEVGTYGISYAAGTQWGLVHNEELPPHLEAMAPGFAVASYYGQGAYSGGAVLLSHNLDYLTEFATQEYNQRYPDQDETTPWSEGEFTFLEEAYEAMPQLHWDLPVVPFEPLRRAGFDWIEEWHTHETYGEYWAQQDHTLHYDKVDVPVLNYGGWYDIFDQGTVWNFQGLLEEGQASDGAALVMGPYTHGANEIRAQGAVMGSAYQFPENATYDTPMLLLSWFDRVLKDDCPVPEPEVRLYVPGLDEWIGGSEFPLETTEFTKYYLHSDGNANASDITDDHYDYEGVLSTEKPGDETPDEYTYDPDDPVVTNGGYNTHWHGGINDRATSYHRRNDILVYETDILEEDVAVVGPITATLYASTSAVDTDFVVTLSDVDIPARAGGLRVAEGARRGRIGDVSADPRELETYSETEYLEPDDVYEWKIAVWPTARVFEEGHRIRVDITSSDFPRYSRNLNTGEGLTGTETVEAKQTVYHDAERPSHVEMPLVPMSDVEDRIIDGPVPGGTGARTPPE